MKNRLFFTCFLFGTVFLYSTRLYSQATIGKPDILNYFYEDLKSGAQTWKIQQDRLGNIYFANNSGLLSYNGNEWKLVRLPNKTIVRSLYIAEDNKIYVGGQDAIGYFFPNQQGTLIYHSLTELIPAQHQKLGDVWNIVNYQNDIFFRTATSILRYITKEKRFTIYIAPERSSWEFMGVSPGGFFAQNGKHAFFKFDTHQWQPVPNPLPQQSLITAVVGYGKDTSLITTLTHGLFLMMPTKIWPLKVSQRISNSQVFCALQVSDKLFALGTVSDGVFLIDKTGATVMHFSTGNGMQNNNVLSLYKDAHSNLWAGLDAGIDLINYQSPFTKITPLPLSPAPTYTVNIFKGKIYLGTSDGLFSANLTVPENEDLSFSQEPFVRVKNSDRQVWNLFNNGEQLLMAHHNGSFEVVGNQATQLDKSFWGTWLYRQIPGGQNLVAGTYDGIQLFVHRKKTLVPTKELGASLNESLRFIEIDGAKKIVWASHPYRGIFKIDMAPNFDRIIRVKRLTQKNGLPGNMNNFVFKVRGDIVFATEKGIYEFDEQQQLFKPSAKYAPVFGTTSVKYMVEDKKGRIWYATEQGMGVVEGSRVEPIPELDGKLIAGFENVYPYNDHNIFIGSNKGMIHLNYAIYQKSTSTINAKLNKVVATGFRDSLLFNDYFSDRGEVVKTQSERLIYRLKPVFSSFHFEFSSDRLGGGSKISYTHQLEGFDKEWSAWSERTEKDYTNLSYGRYTFKVKARDNLGNISEPVFYTFEVLPRWYQTNLAYTGYLLLLGTIIYLVSKIQKKRLETQRRKHESEQAHLKYVHDLELGHNEKKIIQLKNEKLETEVLYKNKELATTTMHLYKRGRLLGKIKDDLSEGIGSLKHQEDKAAFKKLIKLLAEEEKQDQDWEQFAIHFDQVHNNFLNKIKKTYPGLTPGDLKICAYLKMNLSSKEIAQLLNISLKGVEIGRYRLRKKIGISQETNLIDFILQFS